MTLSDLKNLHPCYRFNIIGKSFVTDVFVHFSGTRIRERERERESWKSNAPFKSSIYHMNLSASSTSNISSHDNNDLNEYNQLSVSIFQHDIKYLHDTILLLLSLKEIDKTIEKLFESFYCLLHQQHKKKN